ncbi:MAG: homoserine dehydrogenase, partial [Oscillospiraceae bacterium]
MIKIAVMGYGVVGSGVVELVGGHKELLKKALGEEISVKKILVRREYKECSVSELFTQKVEDIIEDDEISVVVEAIGGVNPALNYVSWALEKGKSVVTSNKELIATHGYELMQLAIKNGVNLLFEASVGGAIPIIRPMNTCLAANNITKIQGILNGTTNFILSKMHSDKLSFSLALKQAQELGYAESDPTADVEGIDALRKICILSSMAYGKHIYPKYITPQGISKISSEDDEIAGGLNGVIKLIAYSKKQE